jgi:hypothetical protein
MTKSVEFQLKLGEQFAIAACIALVPLSVTMAGELTYAGTWDCDASPKMILPAVSAPASAVRDGDRLTVSRVVKRRGSGEEIGRLAGTAVIRDGRVTVEATSTGADITARMTGTVSDSEIELSGSEHVKLLGDGREDDRSCRVRLTRKK